jgi:hypothetical protein
MTRVGWLLDEANYIGSAELTMAEFAAASPEGVELIACPPGGVEPGLDRYVIGNCVLYTLEDLKPIETVPTVKYWHDVGPYIQPEVKEWLSRHTVQVCCSPVQADYMGIAAKCIPPPINLDRFRVAAANMNGGRRGAVSIGSWRNYGKAAHRAHEYDASVDFFGSGPFAPAGSREVAYDAMPILLASYETFVYLPIVIEPFGRLVAEAYAAGCKIVTNNLVGAKWWIENDPDALDTAGEAFWKLALA